MKLSLIMCTHNPRPDYLRRALDALKAQTLPFDAWEFLFVDNASRERLSDRWDLSWHPRARHVREDELGLTPARLRGINEARAGLLVFADDDNVLAPDYLETAVMVAQRHPYLGVFGAGTLAPEFEVEPHSALTPLLSLLALRCVPSARWSNHLKDVECFPWGAGLCASRQTAVCFSDLVHRLKARAVLGRRGQELFCAEDDLFSWASVAVRRGFGLFPELRITHLISAGRLTPSYFLGLVRAHEFSHSLLRFLLAGSQPPRSSLLGHARVLLHGVRRGLFSMRCHWAMANGRADALRFIAANGLRPIAVGDLHGGTSMTAASAPHVISDDVPFRRLT